MKNSGFSVFYLLFIIPTTITFVSVIILSSLYVFSVIKVMGEAMSQSFPGKTSAIIDKQFYKIMGIKRNEVIVYYRNSSSTQYIKRVIGLPNETIK